MSKDTLKVLENPALNLSKQVAAERLKRSGVVIGKDMKLRPLKTTTARFPSRLIKHLAGD
jgi:hypothetical protein